MKRQNQLAPVDSAFEPKGAYVQLQSLLQLRFPAQQLNLFSKKLSRSDMAGNFATRFRGRGMDFEEVRPYQAGDDVRSIDWRVTARTQVPHTKIYREERERPIIVALDQRAPHFFGSKLCFKSVLGSYMAASIAWAGLALGDKVGGVVLGNEKQKDIRPKRHKHAVLEFLTAICEFNNALTSPTELSSIGMADWLMSLRRIAKPGSCLFIISDFHDLDHKGLDQLLQLGKHCDLRLLHLYDPIEQSLQSNTPLTVTNGSARRVLNAHLSDFQRDYKNQFIDQMKLLEAYALQSSARLLSFSTHQPLQEKLRNLFAQ